jgi:hypothetical protein
VHFDFFRQPALCDAPTSHQKFIEPVIRLAFDSLSTSEETRRKTGLKTASSSRVRRLMTIHSNNCSTQEVRTSGFAHSFTLLNSSYNTDIAPLNTKCNVWFRLSIGFNAIKRICVFIAIIKLHTLKKNFNRMILSKLDDNVD